jgi:hypothetical protein
MVNDFDKDLDNGIQIRLAKTQGLDQRLETDFEIGKGLSKGLICERTQQLSRQDCAAPPEVSDVDRK